MENWQKLVQNIIEEIDICIRNRDSDALTLEQLASRLGYSPHHFSRKFREISGMQLRDYLRGRRLAFALKALRDGGSILEVALDHGFASHEAFSRAFRSLYGLSPSEYRQHPRPLALRTILKPFDCHLMESASWGSAAAADIKTYFVRIPAHKFLHIRNYESIGYWDFWQKQNLIPGQDCDTICGLLDSIGGKLDDLGGSEADSGSGQVMGFINAPEGRICSWGIPLAEAYGARLPLDFSGETPPQMLLMDVPEGEYIVFEHGPFDFEQQHVGVEAKIEASMKDFDYAAAGYALDLSPERVFYFYYDPLRCWKYVRPVRKTAEIPS